MKRGIHLTLLLALFTLVLSACGSSATYASGPEKSDISDTLKIRIHPVTGNQPEEITVRDAAKIEDLYQKIQALPAAPADRICTMQAGPRYDLTFLNGETVTMSATADKSGCGTVTIGKDDQRQPDQDFWEQLDALVPDTDEQSHVIPANTTHHLPEGLPNRLQIVMDSSIDDQSETFQVNDVEVVQKLYKTATNLPPMEENRPCPKIAGPSYTLTFSQDEAHHFTMKANRSGCGTVSLAPNDVRMADGAFWSLLTDAIR